MPPVASEPVGENEVASRQRGEVPLTGQEVASEQRNTRQEPDPVARMIAMLKDLQQEVVRDRAPGPLFYRMLGQTHVNGWSRVIASQNGGSTDYIFPL